MEPRMNECGSSTSVAGKLLERKPIPISFTMDGPFVSSPVCGLEVENETHLVGTIGTYRLAIGM
jgi:hypothetical protein